MAENTKTDELLKELCLLLTSEPYDFDTAEEAKRLIKQYGEIFIPVRGYEGTYEISNHGNIRSLTRVNTAGGLLKQGKNKAGYMVVSLSSNGSFKTHNVHRLVALNFISNPKWAKTVNHIDGDKTNNHYFNLEWVTQCENNSHARRAGLSKTFKEGHYKTKLKMSDVNRIKELYSNGVKQPEIAKEYGVGQTTISAIVTGRSWKKEVL